MNIETRILSSLEKVYLDQDPKPCTVPFTALQNEAFAFQVALRPDVKQRYTRIIVKVTAKSELPIIVKQVQYVPCLLPMQVDDGRYERTTPGLFPDPLKSADKDDTYFVPTGRWSSFFVEVFPGMAKEGEYPITLSFSAEIKSAAGSETLHWEVNTSLTVIGTVLPKSQLRYTCWFHGDCIADYYNVPVFSEEHWTYMDKQIKLAADRGQNMILTPIHTPPLDTWVGGERTTIQLIDVSVVNEEYSFDFKNLDRWIDMCLANGIEYFEMAHLFSQWGATACPKIMATVDGEYKKIFGWENKALSDEYKGYLTAMLPALTTYLDSKGLHDKVYFHISDEPHGEHLLQYQKLKEFVSSLLDGFIIMDALSDYSFYEKGVLDYPVVATTALDPFLEGNRPNQFWIYYCIGQNYRHVSNRFFSLPGYRTRILGLQCYKENVFGFLHWGLNFYNSQYSLRHLDPYKCTDADGAHPGGESYVIYPGENGEPVESQRLVIFHEAIQDIQALRLLESLTSREYVLSLMDEDVTEKVTFFTYPTGEEYQLKLRYKVNQKIAELTKL